MTAAMLPFDVRIELPRSAICAHATTDIVGHRVKIIHAGKKNQRQMCSRCKLDLVHDRDLGTYVSPFLIEEEPV